LGGQTVFPSIQGGFRFGGIQASGEPLGDSSEGAIILDDTCHGFRYEFLGGSLVFFNAWNRKGKTLVGAIWVSVFGIDHPGL